MLSYRSSHRFGSVPTRATPCGVFPLKARRQQMRYFRFGLWSYTDPEFSRELRRRYRMLKYRCPETLNHKSSRDHDPVPPRSGLKASAHLPDPTVFAQRTFGDKRIRISRHRFSAEKQTTPTEVPPRPNSWSHFDSWKQHVDQVVNSWSKEASKGATQLETQERPGKPKRTLSTQKENKCEPAEEFVIDPISNRKVPKPTNRYNGYDGLKSGQAFQPYGQQFEDFAPPKPEEARLPFHSNGPPPDSELDKYRQVDVHDWTTSDKSPEQHYETSFVPEVPVMPSEGLNHLPPEETPEELSSQTHELETNGDELAKYKPYMYNEKTHGMDPPSDRPDTRNDQDDLRQYRSSCYYEINSPRHTVAKCDNVGDHQPTEDSRRDFEDPLFSQYGDLEKYKAFRYQETSSMPTVEKEIVDESHKEYDENKQDNNSCTYEKSLASIEETLRAYEARGKLPESFVKIDLWDMTTPRVLPKMTLHDGHALSPVDGQQHEDMLLPLSDGYYQRDPEVDGIPSMPTSLSSKPSTNNDAAPVDQPTIYKILAFDPTMQIMNMAETTSVVPDEAIPLSPTEVLLRLSNPAKFFPHFAPLRAEGFEIVSGSGNVLVFRKIRIGEKERSSVNPIDMMGSSTTALPNAAAFVSPTGFVNYDVPRVVEEQQEPQEPGFKSNIDVRREEPVFSGQKKATRETGLPKTKKKLGIGKRMLVGGAWMAGIAYALGVVSEYFTTGGMDGKGPTGF
ncbi:hypothetical protein F5Y15DRAFT_290138 [Xylariaceae sp. FL0016]|nr:hypothetical protein F5Y15DRAFT_290138 [Xylariaceae sp. FL0016]